VKSSYKVPGPAKGRLVNGQRGSVSFLGMHMGNPEKDEILGLESSEFMKGAPVYPTEKTAFRSAMRRFGPFWIFMLPSA
jgi:hypothetical protein